MEWGDLDGEARERLAKKLRDVAFRYPKDEPLCLSIARSAGMVDVEREILRLRQYAQRREGARVIGE